MSTVHEPVHIPTGVYYARWDPASGRWYGFPTLYAAEIKVAGVPLTDRSTLRSTVAVDDVFWVDPGKTFLFPIGQTHGEHDK